jgi:hypothetical protein
VTGRSRAEIDPSASCAASGNLRYWEGILGVRMVRKLLRIALGALNLERDLQLGSHLRELAVQRPQPAFTGERRREELSIHPADPSPR